ncbi:MAG: ABC transporter permease [Clostridia bacterium]|nr:ABC transporter permease [Deltaproteobacteria bacterium]
MRYVAVAIAVTTLVAFALPIGGILLGARASDLVAAVHDGEVWAALGVSLGCALSSTLLTVLTAVPLGLAIARGWLPVPLLWSAMVELLVVVPHPLVGLGLLLIFARNRLLGAALSGHLGIEVASAVPGIVFAMYLVSAPAVIKSSRDSFRRTPTLLTRVAQSLGATPWRVFWTVELRLAWLSIRSATVVAWARALSEFGAIAILAYYPRTTAVLIWDRYQTYGIQAAVAPALVLLAVAVLTLALLHWLETKEATYEELQR